MRITTTIVTLLVMGSVLTTIAPAVGALDIGCIRADADGHVDVTSVPAGTVSAFTPTALDVTSWTPACVIIPLGGSVTFTQRDAISHGVLSNNECIKLGLMRPLGTTSLEVAELVEDEEGRLSARLDQNGGELNFCEFPIVDNVMTIDYYCEFHGPGMAGVVKVEL